VTGFLTHLILGLAFALGAGAPAIADSLPIVEDSSRIIPSDSTSSAAPRRALRSPGTYIVIDRYANRLFLRTADSVLMDAVCSTGSGAVLSDSITGRRWVFDTPAGRYKVTSKLVDPWWRKPDWAFIEDSLPIPTSDRDRFDSEMLGAYAIGFGDGFFIHGTLYERLLGVSITHGCVRLGAEDLENLYRHVSIGTPVYIY
jgi:hypothetical protein